MQVTLRANCWDGERRKSWSDAVVVAESTPRFADKLKQAARRLNDPKVKAVIGFAVPLMLLAHGLPPIGAVFAHGASTAAVMAFAPEAVPVMSEVTKSKILHAFDPLINMAQSLSYPIAGVMIAVGCLFIMVGQKDKGVSMLQNAAIGYILVQLSPMFLELLVGIGNSV